MRKSLLLFSAVIALLLLSCDDEPEYPGFSRTETGLYYKLQRIGEGDAPAKTGDYVTTHVTYRTESDSLIFEGEQTYQLASPRFEGSFEEGLTMLNEGDSATFLVNADSVFMVLMSDSLPSSIAEGSMLKVDVKMQYILRAGDLHEKEEADRRAEQAYREWIDNADLRELEVMGNYLKKHLIKVKPTDQGLFILEHHKGKGRKIRYKRKVAIHYEGFFLDGTKFDSTYDREEPLQFVLGTDGQVIKGIEYALYSMYVGSRAKLLVPSFIAFGGKGSSTGIVPPYTPLIYNLEVVQLKPNN